jgi:kynurenine formamidase
MTSRAAIACILAVTLSIACVSSEGRGPIVANSEAPLPERIIDLSPQMTEDLPLRVWGAKLLTDWGFKLHNEVEDIVAEEPTYVANSYWTLANHVGAHLDAPNHMEMGAKSISDYALDELIGHARLLDFRSSPIDEPISIEEIERSGIRAGEVALFMVGYSPPEGDGTLPSFPYLSIAAAEYLAELPVKAFATDAWSVESAARMYQAIGDGATGYQGVAPLHRAFLSRGIPVYEQLENLESLVGLQRLVFIGFPLNMHGSNGSPVRAAALVY